MAKSVISVNTASRTVQNCVLIRHAETKCNKSARWHSRSDEPISPSAFEETRSAARRLVNHMEKPSLVLASHLARAVQTAEIFLELLPGAELVRDDLLRERDMGDWTGLAPAEVETRWPGRLAAWERGEAPGPPNGETDVEVKERAMEALRNHAWRSDEAVLVVTHGGVIRSLLQCSGAENVAVPHLGGYWTHLKHDSSEWWMGEKVNLGDPHAVPRT